MPPIWDATSGVFAPAVYLYESGYDMSGLLKEPGYLSAGPNVHSLGLPAHFTYLIMQLSVGNPKVYLPALHMIHFALAAITLMLTFRIAMMRMGGAVSALLAILLLFTPSFGVQVSYVHSPMIGATCTILAIWFWASRRYGWMVTFVFLACLVKSFSISLVACLMLLMLLESSRSLAQRLAWAGSLLGISAFVEVTKTLVDDRSAERSTDLFLYLESVYSYLIKTPDIFFLVLMSIIIPFTFLVTNRLLSLQAAVGWVEKQANGDSDQRLWLAVYMMPLTFFGFILAVPITYPAFIPLIRYYVWILPYMVLGTVYSIYLLLARVKVQRTQRTLRSQRRLGAITLLVVVIVFTSLNRYGEFYPHGLRPYSSFSIVERSYEYLDFYNIQKAALNSAAESHQGMPVFVTRGEFYALSSPMMGYVSTDDMDVRFLLDSPWMSADIDQFPDRFLLVDANSNASHGQAVLLSILGQARSRSDYQVSRVTEHRSGPYGSSVVEVTRALNQ